MFDPYRFMAIRFPGLSRAGLPRTAREGAPDLARQHSAERKGSRDAMNPETADTIKRLRAARAYANLNQPELAERIGVSPATYKRAELGERPVSTEELLKIAHACGVPPSYLLRPWLEGAPERRRVPPGDVMGRLDIIDGRLDAIEETVRRVFATLEPLIARLDAEPEPVEPA
jgi:transcriptional regulator with XRE-family HTH domain